MIINDCKLVKIQHDGEPILLFCFITMINLHYMCRPVKQIQYFYHWMLTLGYVDVAKLAVYVQKIVLC